MKMHTVKQLARLSGVSVRTLHYYDGIGLLRPAQVGTNGYRLYGEEQLLRLQQILIHRELGLPLAAIESMLAQQGRERIESLKSHRDLLVERAGRYHTLIATLDHTIATLEGESGMKPEHLYEGFSSGKQAAHETWLVERYGPPLRQRIDESRTHLARQSAEDLAARIQALARLEAELAQHCRARIPLDDPRLSTALSAHRDWVALMWGRPCPPAAYAGLADLYESHPDFRERYETLAPGLADYLPAAMRAWAGTAGPVSP